MPVDFGGSGSRRVFAERILRAARAQAAGGVVDLSPSIAGLPVASSVTASDSFPFITVSGNGYRGTARLIRDYVLGISGGTATIPENLTVSGTLTANGNTTIGNATSDTLTVTARLNSHLLPISSGTYDLGAGSLIYRNLYVSSILSASSGFSLLDIRGTSGTRLFTSSGAGYVAIRAGTPSSSSPIMEFHYSSSTIDSYRTIIPTSTASYDLGLTANRWRHGYFTGTVTATTLVGNLAYTNLTYTGLTVGQVLRAVTTTTVAFGALDLANASAVTGTLPNARTTATAANTASTIVSRDASGNFAAGTITAALIGNVTGNADTATTAGSAASVPWSGVTSTPTTIAGYGITDFVSLGDAQWVQLDATSLPASIVSSSLTTLGTLLALDVSGDTTLGGDVTFAGPWQHPDVIAGTFTIAANHRGALLGPVGVSGTIDVAGTLAILA